MVHDRLKELRQKRGYTLKELSSYTGDGTGNLSSYENGRLHARDETLRRLLESGYQMSKKEAQQTIAVWRQEELEEKYAPQLAQNSKPYNASKKTGDLLDQYLSQQKLTPKDTKKIKDEVMKMVKACKAKKR